MAELADALDLGSSGSLRAGSSPVIRTKNPALEPFCAPGVLLCPRFSHASKTGLNWPRRPAASRPRQIAHLFLGGAFCFIPHLKLASFYKKIGNAAKIGSFYCTVIINIRTSAVKICQRGDPAGRSEWFLPKAGGSIGE